MIARRSFLLGIGALVSATFVARARAHVFETASMVQPLACGGDFLDISPSQTVLFACP
jgi:hypothetical protein